MEEKIDINSIRFTSKLKTYPKHQISHASIPDEERTLPADLVRLSIGIEDCKDLMTDLREGFICAYQKYDLTKVHWFDSKFEDLPRAPNSFSDPRLELWRD